MILSLPFSIAMGWDASNLGVGFIGILLVYSEASGKRKARSIMQFIHLLLQTNLYVLLLDVDTSNKPDDLPFCLCLSFQLLNVLVIFTKARKKLIAAFGVFERSWD
jgi:GTP-binding protein EngB required for normal cell division